MRLSWHMMTVPADFCVSTLFTHHTAVQQIKGDDGTLVQRGRAKKPKSRVGTGDGAAKLNDTIRGARLWRRIQKYIIIFCIRGHVYLTIICEET
jgi:hypothetical protein